MAEQDTGVKVPSQGMPTAQAKMFLGQLMMKALGGDRIVLSHYNRPIAAVIGIRDLERLRALDAAEAAA